MKAALGFRVKSGWGMAVLITGTRSAPKVVDRRRIELADNLMPDSVQPFHAGLDLPKAAATKTIARLVKCVERVARSSVNELVEQYASGGYRVTSAGLVVGSTVDPETIKNDHIRAHAEEGRLFRVVIKDSLEALRTELFEGREAICGADDEDWTTAEGLQGGRAVSFREWFEQKVAGWLSRNASESIALVQIVGRFAGEARLIARREQGLSKFVADPFLHNRIDLRARWFQGRESKKPPFPWWQAITGVGYRDSPALSFHRQGSGFIGGRGDCGNS